MASQHIEKLAVLKVEDVRYGDGDAGTVGVDGVEMLIEDEDEFSWVVGSVDG